MRTSNRTISIFQEVELKLEVRKLNAFREEVLLTLLGDDSEIEQQKPPKKRRRK